MIIFPKMLSDGKYKHNEQAEEALRRDIFERIGLTTAEVHPRGVADPRFDYQVDRFLVEQKITRKYDRWFNLELFYDAQQTKPSAFSLCEAPVTFIIMPGRSHIHNDVWKARLYRTKDLLAAADPDFMEGDFRRAGWQIMATGASCASILIHSIPHLWLGDIKTDTWDAIDTTKFIPNKNVLTQFEDMYSDEKMAMPPEPYYRTYGVY